MNISNTLTLIRIALAPIFGILIIDRLWVLAAIIGTVAIITDVLDGHLARKRDEVTEIGEILDAAADKIFFTFAIFAIYFAFDLPWYVLFLLTRDVLVGVGGLVLLGIATPEKKIDMSSDWSGKTVTVLQVITIGSIFMTKLVTPINLNFIQILVFLTAIFGLLCSIHYLLRAKRRGYI